MSMPKNEPTKVPGKGLEKGGKVQGLQHMHMRADEMAAHDTGTKGMMSGYPTSPPHDNPNLESPVEASNPESMNMSPGLGPIEVPGKGL
jgi:hypothetical protein